MAPSSSRDPDTDPSAHLGQRHLKRVRLAAGFVKQSALAIRLNVSVDYISKAETGAMPPVEDTFLAWLDACDVTGQERDFIYGLWVVARATHSGVPQFAEKYLKREKQAEYLLLWCPVIPSGLFQVPEYARELFLLAGMDEDQAAENVDARLARQAVLDGPDAPHVTMLLHESVLRSRVGTPEVMVKQFTHVLEVSRRRNVIIQVIRGRGYFFGLESQFEIASGEAIPRTLVMVTFEDQTSDDNALVRRATTLFRQIQGHALTTEESRAVIAEAVEQWNSQQQ